MIRWLGVVTVGAALLAAVGWNVASAAQPEPFVIDLDCGSAGQMSVRIIGGDSQWTPGLIVGGGVLVPVAFANQHGTFTDNEGNTEEEFPPDVAKPGNFSHKQLLDCSFSISGEDEGGSFSFEGDVTGFVAGKR